MVHRVGSVLSRGRGAQHRLCICANHTGRSLPQAGAYLHGVCVGETGRGSEVSALQNPKQMGADEAPRVSAHRHVSQSAVFAKGGES